MSAAELEQAVLKLQPDELAKFTDWFEQYVADRWDAQIESDIQAGRLDKLGTQADDAFESGRCSPL